MIYNNPDVCVLSCKLSSVLDVTLALRYEWKKLSLLSLHLFKEGLCRYNPQNVAVKIREYVALPEDEDILMDAVATKGPIATGMHVVPKSFSFYNGGRHISFW